MKYLLKSLVLSVFALLMTGAVIAAEKGSRDEAVALVKKAAAYLRENGKEKAFAEFNKPDGPFVDRDLYIFAYSAGGDGTNLAHGANPKLIGKNLLELRDADGKPIVKNFIEVANGKTGNGWVDYKWANPLTKAVEAKTSYVEKVGDVILGSGVYK
ncbi:cache domain-containing protein [Actimicrobium sp. CCI2.3]|uniref:cache domain-containing protein n=1 Tax=Actimicrobium sp. CCI2.3 TaxID=3048616 RepID=UPI002AB452CB|nr:cache domain-containing protein [Actimicrobium sp. CCI2.3]MDY7574033.1 cache domain-containing protein [Actimicrobium sp. CCI2.3]MEB0021859.1 cache domain-containing protein [Actimicrobium sp. CCI2.3]